MDRFNLTQAAHKMFEILEKLDDDSLAAVAECPQEELNKLFQELADKLPRPDSLFSAVTDIGLEGIKSPFRVTDHFQEGEMLGGYPILVLHDNFNEHFEGLVEPVSGGSSAFRRDLLKSATFIQVLEYLGDIELGLRMSEVHCLMSRQGRNVEVSLDNPNVFVVRDGRGDVLELMIWLDEVRPGFSGWHILLSAFEQAKSDNHPWGAQARIFTAGK